jgi:hypothetical protein
MKHFYTIISISISILIILGIVFLYYKKKEPLSTDQLSDYTGSYTPTMETKEYILFSSKKISSQAMSNNIDLSLFFPPIVNQGKLGDCQTYSMVYYIANYYNAIKNLGLMDSIGTISINNTNYKTLYNATALSNFYSNPNNILNPLYNYVSTNRSCLAKGVLKQNICTVILEYYQLLNSIGTYSYKSFNLEYNNNTITKNNITGCNLSALKKMSLRNKIQPFIKKTYTIIYFYKSSSSSINCTSVASLPARTILNPLYYDSIINSENILPLMKQFLNRGVPIRCAITYTSNINKPKSFSKYFGRTITNKKIFPSVSDDAVITDLSYDPTDRNPISHVITICGYSDFLVGDGSSGVFKIINSWGKNVGINGYGFISYNMFFLPVSNGGITRQLIAFE